VLFCFVDDDYALLNPHGARRYESIKRLSDSEIVTLALFQQLRGVESERSRTLIQALSLRITAGLRLYEVR
jgi:hypothetical protein